MQHIVSGSKYHLWAEGGSQYPQPQSRWFRRRSVEYRLQLSFGPDGAVFATYKFSNVFSVQTELEYSSQGARRDGMQAFPVPDAYANYFNPGTILYANFKGQVKLGYLVLPVMAKFQWNFKPHSPFKFYIEGGPFIGQLLSAYLVTSGNSNVYADASGQHPLLPDPLSFDTTANIKNQLHTTNFGAEVNVGISYQLGRGYIFVEGGVNYSFLNIQKEAANGKNTTGAATVCLGLHLRYERKNNRFTTASPYLYLTCRFS